ncbi:MAG TPA: hypothetical protein ENJ53_04325 [Phaeodactylibacter sp.]|nr:hypothetical protein [Phaeodactylibacter sp.]
MINRYLVIIGTFILFTTSSTHAQDFVFQTFKDTRVINAHSVETVPDRKLDFRIGHRFGDITNGWNTLYGLENAADVLFSFEYGISDELTIGIGRTKGAGPVRALVSPSIKYRILHQRISGVMPISLTLFGVTSISTTKSDGREGSLGNFTQFDHRMSYTVQALLARKFSDRFSLQIVPGYTHRNLVSFDDVNGIFSVAAATRIQINKVFGIIADATFPLANRPSGYYPAIGVGLEIETGGHIFQINFTNAMGIIENDYIPYTSSNWGDGQFRLGFTISRLFNL